MNFKALTKAKPFRPALGAALAVLCGLALWKLAPGERWVNASYDYLFRIGARPVTNQVTVLLMDNESYDYFHQDRRQPWSRDLHARLLQRLADDGCALVVFDSFFRAPRSPAEDDALVAGLSRQRAAVLMAEQAELTHPAFEGARPTLPDERFLTAAKGNWGVAWLDPDLDGIVRRHWPFPAPGPYPSLPWVAARVAGAELSQEPRSQWLRYYGPDGAWDRLSYRFALTQPTNYFRDRIVFVGTQPKASVADGEPDQFRTPYTRWTGESVGGVEILATAFLNLANGEWLARPVWWVEAVLLVVTGVLLGAGLSQLRPLKASAVAAVAAIVVSLGAVSWSHFTNLWFPWLVIAGGQVPLALAWSLATRKLCRVPETVPAKAAVPEAVAEAAPKPATTGQADEMPDTPGYELFSPPFGRGAYGKVWLARNAVGQWQALKAVHLSDFNQNTDPYEREFNGIRRYKPISDKHPGLLRVDFVSLKRPGYFYYVMELGDPLVPGWERTPSTYKPRDLVSARTQSPGRRLPIRECLRIGLALSEALDFLHQQGLIHRDIKPQNVIFVNGQPKLADVGLMAEIRPPGEELTLVGTPGYMPPAPERPGTAQADIYSLGMVLYVLSTGNNPTLFPALSTTLANHGSLQEFFPLNTVILNACQPDVRQRYRSAADMHKALRQAYDALQGQTPEVVPEPVA